MAASLMRGALRATPLASGVARRALSTTKPALMMEKSTGQTGLAAVVGLGALAAISQEILILHSESVVVGSLGLMTYVLYKKAGPVIAESLDAPGKAVLENMSVGKNAKIEALTAQLEEEKMVPAKLAGLKDLFEVSRELNAMTRELEYRQTKHATAAAALSELNLVVKIENDVRAQEQASIVKELEEAVLSGLKGMEKDILNQCVADLDALAAAQ
eukprot:m.19069 g.19069  ORF g.19069 m.19069 type:complete len:216 (-) comp11702_c0_seq1:168-815(-)